MPVPLENYMKITCVCALFLCLSGAVSTLPAQAPAPPSLHGTITDPSGALVPGALVQLRGPGGEQRKTTDIGGQYNFPRATPGQVYSPRNCQGLQHRR